MLQTNTGDYDLLIAWKSLEAIQTDYTMIVTENLLPPMPVLFEFATKRKGFISQAMTVYRWQKHWRLFSFPCVLQKPIHYN